MNILSAFLTYLNFSEGSCPQRNTISKININPTGIFTLRGSVPACSNGTTVERADGGKLTEMDFLKGLPKKYVRAKLELNKAKIKSEGLDDDVLAALGLVRITTMSMKLKPRAA